MILVDTSIWVDHLRRRDSRLIAILEAGQVLSHSFVIAELALGSLKNRKLILESLNALPRTVTATNDELLDFVEHHNLFGTGIGFVDAHLLASVHLVPGSWLWTRDKRLRAVAGRMAVKAQGLK